MILILDLDNTIFETQSMSSTLFQPLITKIENYLKEQMAMDTALLVVKDLWKHSFDVVMTKHKIPSFSQKEIYGMIEAMEYNLEISTYPDYSVLKKRKEEKFLVTTGFRKLQQAKIKALNIESDFKAIYIDDPADQDRRYKMGIFKEILNQSNKELSDFWVIGDSSESELKAGRGLGMNTIQRLGSEAVKSNFADYAIYSFDQLDDILNGEMRK